MDASTQLIKSPSLELLFDKFGDFYLVLNKQTKDISLFSETSMFLFEHCNGQAAEEICSELFNACIDQDELDKEQVIFSCMEALLNLLNIGLLQIKK